MKREKNKVKLTKIEINDKTCEPKIVKINPKKVKNTPLDYKDYPQPEIKSPTNQPESQIVMNRVLGMDKTNFDSINRRQKMFKNVFTILFFGVVIGVLIYTFLHDFVFGGQKVIGFGDFMKILSGTWYYLIFALISLAFCFIFKGLKLSILCKKITRKWHLKTCVETAVVGLYYNNVTPLAVGGQPFEIYHLSKHGVHGGVASSLPIATYFLSQFAFVILGVTAITTFNVNSLNTNSDLIAKFPPTFTWLGSIGLFLCMLMPLLVMIFCMMPKFGSSVVRKIVGIGGKLHLVKDVQATSNKTIKTVVQNTLCLKNIAKAPSLFIANLILGFGEHLALCSIAYFTLRFFSFDMPEVGGFMEWLQIVQICMILYSAISFIPTPGNSGAADLSFYLLFTWGITYSGGAFTAMLVWRILSFYSFIIIGFIFTKSKKSAERKKLAQETYSNGFLDNAYDEDNDASDTHE